MAQDEPAPTALEAHENVLGTSGQWLDVGDVARTDTAGVHPRPQPAEIDTHVGWHGPTV